MSRSGSGGTKVFMGRLPYDTRTRDIEKFFREYGFSRSIRDITVKTGYAFVDFDDSRDADDAVYELNRKELLGSRITLEHARPGGGRGRDNRDNFRDRSYREYRARRGRPYNTEWRIIVENLSSRCGWQDLKDFFREAGEVTFTKCHKERVGEGVVEFARRTDMKTALRKMDGKELYGKKIRLIDDSPKDAHDSASPRRSNSRSRSRSRSRRSHTRSRSPSPSRGHSVERSRSPSPRRRSLSKSRSRSPSRFNNANNDKTENNY